MKKIFLVLFILIYTFSFGQSAKEMLKEIQGKWSLDDNNNVTVVRIIEVPNMSKDEIFQRALNYFTYNYVSGKSVIQTQDKESGVIVGKGLYENVHKGINVFKMKVSAWHILRVDVKEGKARAIVTLLQYEKEMIVSGNSLPNYSTSFIAQEYPINPKGANKTIMGKAFYKTFKKANATLENLEKTIKEGSTSKDIENSDW
ncbi:DUF4468 domain-containing protein [Apibacter sp. B3706]|uniref:DUF4468 domain-containing protein n=1 Tax=Apibacter sp. B3706 TaxID=2656760 RepID=UPI00140DBB6E|nr:DUF4468 domain-containing protein [Apibacter sp. B3706]QII69991.1 DUF4468 domain-containing protein [Apibacter sp. B3706]